MFLYVVYALLLGYFYKIVYRWIEGRKLSQNIRIDGKIVILTGGDSGIGLATAIELLKRGAKVCVASLDVEYGEKAKRQMIAMSGSENVIVRKLNLASFKSIREFVRSFKEEHQRLDILINNAGVLVYNRTLTDEGFEAHMGINHLGHFLLVHLLLDTLKASAPSRIINVSSAFHLGRGLDKEDLMTDKDYTMLKAYGRSKIAVTMCTREMANRLRGTGVSVFALHPGIVHTEISVDLIKNWKLPTVITSFYGKYCMKTPEAGAQTTVYCAVEPGLEKYSGKFFRECQLDANYHPAMDDKKMCQWIWNESEKLIQSKSLSSG